MQAIANLIALVIESDVLQRAISKPSVDPISKDSLIGPTELTGTGHDTATIDPNRKIEIDSVLQSQTFRSDFSAAIERHRWHCRIGFCDTIRRYTVWKILLCNRAVRFSRFLNFQAAQ